MAYVAEHVHCHEEEIQPGHFYVRILADAPSRLAVSACYALERKTLRNSPRLSSLRAFRTRKAPALPVEPTPPPPKVGGDQPMRFCCPQLPPPLSPLPPSPIPSPHVPPVCLVRKNSGSGVAANCTWRRTASDPGTQPCFLRPVLRRSKLANSLTPANRPHECWNRRATNTSEAGLPSVTPSTLNPTCQLHATTYSCAPRPASRGGGAIAFIVVPASAICKGAC